MPNNKDCPYHIEETKFEGQTSPIYGAPQSERIVFKENSASNPVSEVTGDPKTALQTNKVSYDSNVIEKESWEEEFDEKTKHWFYGTDIRDLLKDFIRQLLAKERGSEHGKELSAYFNEIIGLLWEKVPIKDRSELHLKIKGMEIDAKLKVYSRFFESLK